jgi:hypothetical protein
VNNCTDAAELIATTSTSFTWRKHFVDFFVVVQCQTKLFQVVLALSSACRLACLLDSGQKQSHQDGDNRNHHQQLNERKRIQPMRLGTSGSSHGKPFVTEKRGKKCRKVLQNLTPDLEGVMIKLDFNLRKSKAMSKNNLK